MKKLLLIAFAVMALSACTPQEVRLWNLTHDSKVNEPPVISPTDRQAALTLPATFVTQIVHGQTVSVVAWVGDDGEARGHFVYDDPAGDRWLVQLNSEPAHAYVWHVSSNPCWADPFGQITYDPDVCGHIPASTPLPS